MFINEISKGFFSFRRAHRVISEHRLWMYIVIPGMMSLVYIIGALFAAKAFMPDMTDYIMGNWAPSFMKGRIMMTVTLIFLWLSIFVLAVMSCKHVILILFSPFLSHLSELVEQIAYGHPSSPFRWKQFFKDIYRSIVINIRIIFMTLLFCAPAWLIAFIPIAGTIVSAILLFLIQSYYSGFGFVDYTLERKLYSVKDSVAFVKSNRSSVTGLGMQFMALMLIPVVGWFFAPAYASVSATLISLGKMYPDESPAF